MGSDARWWEARAIPFFFLKGVAPESGFHRNAKIARGMNPATPFPPSRVGAVQAEVL